MGYQDKQMKRDPVTRLPYPQTWDPTLDNGNGDWKITESSAYKSQSIQYVAADYFSGTANATRAFDEDMHGVSIFNAGDSIMTFTINGVTRPVLPKGSYDQKFKEPFTSISITASGQWYCDILQQIGADASVVVPPPADTSAPTNPATLTASNITAASVDLSWPAATDNVGVTGYEVYRDGNLITTVTGTSYQVTGLNPETGYAFMVKAKDAAGNTSSGTSANATTIAGADTTPPTVTASVPAGTYTSEQTVTLTADETATIYYTLDGSTPTTASTPYSSPIQINATTTLKFFGRDTAGNSSAVQTNVYTINLPDITNPSAVTGLTASNTTYTSTDLTWDAATDNVGVTGYEVYKDGVLLTTVAVTNYQVTGLTPETLYSLSVRAKDAAGNLGTAGVVEVTTSAAPADSTPPNEVTNPQATPGSTTVDLSWTASNSGDVAGYNVYDGAVKKNGALITGTTYQVTGLPPETPFTFTVKVVDTSANESTGVQVSTTTTAAAGGDGPYRLYLNGSDTGIKFPSSVTLTHVEMEVKIFSLNTGGSANAGYLVDFRGNTGGKPNAYVFNGGVGAGIDEYYINGVAGTDKPTHWTSIPKDGKVTLKYGSTTTFATSNNTQENTLFKRSNNPDGYLRVELYKAKLFNGATLVADYNFTNQFAGTQVTDQTGNGRHATILGAGYSWVTG